MKSLVVLVIVTVFLFSGSVATLILGVIRKKKPLKWISLILFITFLIMATWTGSLIISKTYNKVSTLLEPRSNEAIYEALFEHPLPPCVELVNAKDQVVPKLDLAIWLEAKICPSEAKKLLSSHDFTFYEAQNNSISTDKTMGEQPTWFQPATLGDTVFIYDYIRPDQRGTTTIWMNQDSTKVFVRDVFD